MSAITKETQCCIVGGGPAGMMLGFLLARSGVEVIVLEKHKDFFRDFRGDTIHPSTIELMYELGLLDRFLKVPHQEMPTLSLTLEDETVEMVDFSHLPVHCKYIALMPQWDFLRFLAEEGKKYKSFHLMMEAEGTDLMTEAEVVKGVKVKTADGDIEIRADLVVACDGRSSGIRQKAGMKVTELGVPIDVLWFGVPKGADRGSHSLGNIKGNKFLVTIERGDYYQCGYIISKNKFDAVRAEGLEAFRQNVAMLAPFLKSTVQAINNWDQVKLLSVQINYLEQWSRTGLLCIGDAAHAMSPIGGVGINLAIQDAVATANILAPAFAQNAVSDTLLASVQARRARPSRWIQNIQAFMHNNLFHPGMKGTGGERLKIPMWFFGHIPFLNRIPARVIGMGFRPEHIQTPEKLI